MWCSPACNPEDIVEETNLCLQFIHTQILSKNKKIPKWKYDFVVQLSCREIFIPRCSCKARVELAVGIIKKYNTQLLNNQVLIDDCACSENTLLLADQRQFIFLNAILYFQSYFYLFWFSSFSKLAPKQGLITISRLYFLVHPSNESAYLPRWRITWSKSRQNNKMHFLNFTLALLWRALYLNI